MRRHLDLLPRLLLRRHIHRRTKPGASPPPPPPPNQPRPPQKPDPVTIHGETWHDNYAWMGSLSDAAAMRHMDVHMEAEERYAEACLAATGADRLARKLQLEMASRLASDACTPPARWGPWLYYRRADEGKQYPVLCRRSAALHGEFVSYSDPSAGFDFTAGKRIEQKLVDYNKEAERFGGYSYEELSEVSPDHRFIAYTMYDKDKDSFTLMVRDLVMGTLCDKPRADRVSNISWAMDGKALVYIVTNEDRRPYRLFCSIIGSNKDDILILEEPGENIYLNIRHTKDFRFITLNVFSDTHSKVYLIRASDPLSRMTLVWEGESQVHCIVEHHHGRLYLFTDAARVRVNSQYLMQCDVESPGPKSWKSVFLEEPVIILEDVDFCGTHMVLILRHGRKLRLCSVNLPLPENIQVTLISDDKRILKVVLKEGEGYELPNDGAVVRVRLTGKLDGGTVFVKKGHDGDEPFEFKTDEEQVIEGLDTTVVTMKKGEVALARIPPEHAFGSTDTKLDLAVVPPNSTVFYEVELVSFEKEKESWDLKSNAEKIEAAAKKKVEGNVWFKMGKYDKASKRYEKSQAAAEAKAEVGAAAAQAAGPAGAAGA